MRETHLVAVYRWPTTATETNPGRANPFDPPTTGADARGGCKVVGEPVAATYAPGGGGLTDTPAGTLPVGKGVWYLPTGTDVKTGDGLLVVQLLDPTAGYAGERYIVEAANHYGGRWKVAVVVHSTTAVFP